MFASRPSYFLVGAAFVALASLALPAPVMAEPVSLQGSTTFCSRLIEPYRAAIEARAGHRLDVIGNKSIHGLVALLEGRTQLAMISSSLSFGVV